jgi:hypothetical protein
VNSMDDFIRAAQEAKDRVGPPPERSLRLTRAEYDRLRRLCAPVPMDAPEPGAFTGVTIEIFPSCWGLSHMCAELHHKCRRAGTCVLAPPPDGSCAPSLSRASIAPDTRGGPSTADNGADSQAPGT